MVDAVERLNYQLVRVCWCVCVYAMTVLCWFSAPCRPVAWCPLDPHRSRCVCIYPPRVQVLGSVWPWDTFINFPLLNALYILCKAYCGAIIVLHDRRVLCAGLVLRSGLWCEGMSSSAR